MSEEFEPEREGERRELLRVYKWLVGGWVGGWVMSGGWATGGFVSFGWVGGRFSYKLGVYRPRRRSSGRTASPTKRVLTYLCTENLRRFTRHVAD